MSADNIATTAMRDHRALALLLLVFVGYARTQPTCSVLEEVRKISASYARLVETYAAGIGTTGLLTSFCLQRSTAEGCKASVASPGFHGFAATMDICKEAGDSRRAEVAKKHILFVSHRR